MYSHVGDQCRASDHQNPDGSTKWRYYRVDVQFLVDPRSFSRGFANRSTFFRPGGKSSQDGAEPAQIWTGTIKDGETERRIFGTRDQVIKAVSGQSDEWLKNSAQAVSEPMFLDDEGKIGNWDSSSLRLSKPDQDPVYIEGVPHEESDFAGLFLPTNKKA